MMTNGYIIGDGSWTLTIKVTDFNVERRLRVKGDLHIGGVMLRLVEDLGKLKKSKNFVIFLQAIWIRKWRLQLER